MIRVMLTTVIFQLIMNTIVNVLLDAQPRYIPREEKVILTYIMLLKFISLVWTSFLYAGKIWFLLFIWHISNVMISHFSHFLFLHMITHPQLCIAAAMHVLVMDFIPLTKCFPLSCPFLTKHSSFPEVYKLVVSVVTL